MRRGIFIFLFAISYSTLVAVEGKWLPVLLQQHNESEMHDMGMRISAEDIYSVNRSSLKDAVVLFGRGCTGAIISPDGLLLTNHHCGFRQIQRHSTVENNYLTDGFWAMNRGEELPNPGLTVTLMVQMVDVTPQVLEGISSEITEQTRDSLLRININRIQTYATDTSGYASEVRPFFHGNKFFLFFTETFRDVRLVGAPPSNIGKFGGDTDNWMWPRHTGDFALFRIYACKNNKPADFSPDNVPFTPEHYFTISLQGVGHGDFTFIIGYPGRTNQYLPAAGLENIVSVINPATIKLRTYRLDVMNAAMKQDPEVRIQYASKHASIANLWKRLIGETRGVKRLDAVNLKLEQENEFTQWVQSDPERLNKYGDLIGSFNYYYSKLKPWSKARTFMNEAGLAIEIVRFAQQFHDLVRLSRKKQPPTNELLDLTNQLKTSSVEFFKNYHSPIDRKIMAEMLRLYHRYSEIRPEIIDHLYQQYNGDFDKIIHNIFTRSIFSKKEAVMNLLTDYHPRHRKRIENDPAYQLAQAFFEFRDHKIAPAHQAIVTQIDSLQRIYMQALKLMQPQRRFYPDANLTLRVTYGIVEGYYPRNAVYYRYYTTLSGKLEKEDPESYYFVVEEKIKDLYRTRNFGRYADANGEMRICFIASNHTSGGNSGSPVLNAYGHLVGINFDRVWEGTMSDLIYDPDICRNISLDIRYCLFIIDKFAQARHLLDEMTIIE